MSLLLLVDLLFQKLKTEIMFTNSFFAILMTVLSFNATPKITTSNPLANELVGEWVVDLRASPDAVPYLQDFKVSKLTEKSFKGSFYKSKIHDANFNTDWELLHFAFITKDQSNTYYNSGYLKDGVLYGKTHCPKRDFVIPWTATKK